MSPRPVSLLKSGTVEDFLKIRSNPGLDYILTADIDLSGVTDFTGFCNDGVTFTGSIDGKGHAVHGFHIDFSSRSDSDHGLFGKTSGATFKNIAFYDFVIDGGQSVKQIGLIGGGSATFENVAIVGTVIGNDHVGLVAGDSDGIKALEKELLAQNAQHKDWCCTEELIKDHQRRQSPCTSNCLPADINDVSCVDGEVEASVFDRYRTPAVQGGQLQALHHRRHDLPGQGEGPPGHPEGPGGAGRGPLVPEISSFFLKEKGTKKNFWRKTSFCFWKQPGTV